MIADVTSQKTRLPPPGVESSRHVGKALGGRQIRDVTMTEERICPTCGEAHPPKISSGGNRYRRCPVRAVKNARLYRTRHAEKLKKGRKKHQDKWIAANRAKVSAHRTVKLALQSGKLKRQPCEVCGKPDAFAHHEDYNRRLDVTWLCQFHHGARHGEMNLDNTVKPEAIRYNFCVSLPDSRRNRMHIRPVYASGDTYSLCGRVSPSAQMDLAAVNGDMTRRHKSVCEVCRKSYLTDLEHSSSKKDSQ